MTYSICQMMQMKLMSSSERISFGEKFAEMFYHKSLRSEKKIVIEYQNKTAAEETSNLGTSEKIELHPDLGGVQDDNSDDVLQKKLQTSRRMSMSNTHLLVVRENSPEPENEDISMDKYNFTLRNTTRGNITSNNADDTSDLLDLFSKFTGKTLLDDDKVIQQNAIHSGFTNMNKRENEECDTEKNIENSLKQQLKRFSFDLKQDTADNSDCGENSAIFTATKKWIRISYEIVKGPEEKPLENQGTQVCSNADLETVMDINCKGFLDSESVGDLVDKINKLVFMGKDCEWESRRASEWSFLLLHSRVRVTLHMSRDQLTRASVDVARHDPENSIAALTARVAAEALSYVTSSALGRDVCALLRRCACVSRVASNWARVMRDAQLRLAVKVTDDFVVSFKSVNVPLREVWEVKLLIETSLSEDSTWPWPRAVILRVARVTGDGPCQLRNAQKALDGVKECWGHVPEGIWAIFKYLKKYKPREDPMLGLLS